MTERSDLAHRTGFDGVAERYQRARHGYPTALFEELFRRLPARPAVVEVGPGTGQAGRRCCRCRSAPTSSPTSSCCATPTVRPLAITLLLGRRRPA